MCATGISGGLLNLKTRGMPSKRGTQIFRIIQLNREKITQIKRYQVFA